MKTGKTENNDYQSQYPLPTYEETYSNDQYVEVETMPLPTIKWKITLNFICNLIVFSLLANVVIGLTFGLISTDITIVRYIITLAVELFSAVVLYLSWLLAIKKMFKKRKIASYDVPKVSNFMISVIAVLCVFSMISFPMNLEQSVEKELDRRSLYKYTDEELEEIKDGIMKKESGLIIFKIASFVILSLGATVIAKRDLVNNSVDV